MIVTSIVFHPIWQKLHPYLLVDIYDRDGGHKDPRIRIGFVDLPETFSHELVMLVMPCVHCERPNHPLRRRETDDWTRLYYGPCCPLAVRVSCSRGRAAELEYERFKGLPPPRASAQLSLF